MCHYIGKRCLLGDSSQISQCASQTSQEGLSHINHFSFRLPPPYCSFRDTPPLSLNRFHSFTAFNSRNPKPLYYASYQVCCCWRWVSLLLVVFSSVKRVSGWKGTRWGNTPHNKERFGSYIAVKVKETQDWHHHDSNLEARVSVTYMLAMVQQLVFDPGTLFYMIQHTVSIASNQQYVSMIGIGATNLGRRKGMNGKGGGASVWMKMVSRGGYVNMCMGVGKACYSHIHVLIDVFI